MSDSDNSIALTPTISPSQEPSLDTSQNDSFDAQATLTRLSNLLNQMENHLERQQTQNQQQVYASNVSHFLSIYFPDFGESCTTYLKEFNPLYHDLYYFSCWVLVLSISYYWIGIQYLGFLSCFLYFTKICCKRFGMFVFWFFLF